MKVTFYFNNEIINNFNEIWTNRILFEKIENLKLSSSCDIFLIRPSYENDSPFEIIKSMDRTKKIILWYMDTLSEEFYGTHQTKIEELCKLEYDVSVIIPDFHLNGYDLSCEVFNNYSMADCILEQQQIDRKLIKYFNKNSEKLYRQKHFLSFNGNIKPHRIDLLRCVLENELLSKFDISFNSYFWNHADQSLHLDLKSTSSYTSTKLNLPLYYNSYIDVITMANSYSTEDSPRVYIDEKLYKSFACMKPFLIVGQYRTLETLKKLGFKTFSEWIDESYDTEVEYDVRMTKIHNEIKRLSEFSIKEMDELYFKMKTILLHNSSQLGIHIHNTDKKILEIFNG
jgi:hypothetical protein